MVAENKPEKYMGAEFDRPYLRDYKGGGGSGCGDQFSEGIIICGFYCNLVFDYFCV